MKVLLDNTVLSNFALAQRTELLSIALGDSLASTVEVLNEFGIGVSKGLLPATDLGWLDIIDLTPIEQGLCLEFLTRLNAGEASCLAVAVHRTSRFFTDDRDARKLAAQLQVPVSGTLGILLRLVQIHALTMQQANALLALMVAKGYRSPVGDLGEL